MSDPYTIEHARMAIRGAGFAGALLDPQEEETVRMARLAIREHERSEALAARVADLEAAAEAYRLDSVAMEARAVRAEAAVGRIYTSPTVGEE